MSEDNKTPLQSVSVYLDNTSVGTVTKEDGSFVLAGIPAGKFRLVATSVGYETFSVIIDSRDLRQELLIFIKPKSENLEEFSVVPPDPDGWKKWGILFTTVLIGTTPNSYDCKLENPEVIKFRLSKENILTAYSNEPIKVTNYALGYMISYKLEEFECNLSNALINYRGFAFFLDLGLSHPKKQKKYLDKRFDTYKGSLLHFMRSYYANALAEQGFEMRNLDKIENAEKKRARKMFEVYGNKPITFNKPSQIGYEVGSRGAIQNLRTTDYVVDSTDYFKKVLKQPDSLISHELITADSIGFAVDSMVAGMYFYDSLEVSYKWKSIPARYKALSKNHKETYPISQFVFTNGKPIYIIKNGFYYDPYDLKITGYWAWSESMSNWLPFNYYP